MIQSPVFSLSGPPPEPAPEPTPGGTDAPTARSVDATEFLGLLADARYRFPPEDQASLCRWVAPILNRWTRWPDGVQLAWAGSAPPTPPGDLDRRTEWVLRVGPGERSEDGERQTGLQVEWDGAHPATDARSSRRPRDSFTPQPGDLFDALAQAAIDHWSARTRVQAHGCQVDGMELRRTLIDLLQTTTGTQWGTPVLTRPADPVPLAPERKQSVGTQPVVAPCVGKPSIPEPPVAQRAVRLFRPWLDDTPAPAKRRTLAVLRREPMPPLDAVGALAHTLRQGRWCEALEHLTPTLATRLPPGHRLHQYFMQVYHPRRTTTYGPPRAASGTLRIFWDRNGRLVSQYRTHPSVTYPPSADAFLRAVLACPESDAAEVMPWAREELAQLIECNPVLTRVSLALFNKNMPGDQDVLLRLCLVGKTLTMAGEQLLDPSSAQRPVQIEDLVRWYRRWESARCRMPECLRSEGISILDAQRYAGPLHPTPEGQRWLKQANQPFVSVSQPDANEVFRAQLPALRYAFRTITNLMPYLGIAQKSYLRWVSGDFKTSVEAFCVRQGEEERLVLPTDPASSSPGSSASCT